MTPWAPGTNGPESGETSHRRGRLRLFARDPVHVEDDPSSRLGGARGNEHELGAECHSPTPLEMQARIRLVANLPDRPGPLIHPLVAESATEERTDHFSVRMQQAG